MAGGGRNYVFMSGRGPWGMQAECRLATVMTADFPVWMFFSARCRVFVGPTSLLYRPAEPFMDNTGVVSVVLLRDARKSRKSRL